jgi:hypothetical protein
MQTFQVNAPQVVYETFADEVVIVNLETGIYYSTQKSGAALWSRLVKNIAVEQIIDELNQNNEQNGETDAQVSTAVWRFVEQLQEQSLIVPSTTPSTSTAQDLPVYEGEKATLVPAWDASEPPVLVEYADMQDLLLLDPIHDVDESGWPNLA